MFSPLQLRLLLIVFIILSFVNAAIAIGLLIVFKDYNDTGLKTFAIVMVAINLILAIAGIIYLTLQIATPDYLKKQAEIHTAEIEERKQGLELQKKKSEEAIKLIKQEAENINKRREDETKKIELQSKEQAEILAARTAAGMAAIRATKQAEQESAAAEYNMHKAALENAAKEEMAKKVKIEAGIQAEIAKKALAESELAKIEARVKADMAFEGAKIHARAELDRKNAERINLQIIQPAKRENYPRYETPPLQRARAVKVKHGDVSPAGTSGGSSPVLPPQPLVRMVQRSR